MKFKIIMAFWAASGMLLFCSCDYIKKAGQAVHGLMEVQKQVSDFLGGDQVTVNISGGGNFMAIGIVNSKLDNLDEDSKKAKMREIAQVAYDAYPSRDDLKTVQVRFITSNSIGIVHFTKNGMPLAFSAEDLKKTSKVKPSASPTPQNSGSNKT